MVNIGGAETSRGCGILIVSAVDPSGAQLPSTKFLTACGVASTPMALGSAVAQDGMERPSKDEKGRTEKLLATEVLERIAGARMALFLALRSKLWLILCLVSLLNVSICFLFCNPKYSKCVYFDDVIDVSRQIVDGLVLMH